MVTASLAGSSFSPAGIYNFTNAEFGTVTGWSGDLASLQRKVAASAKSLGTMEKLHTIEILDSTEISVSPQSRQRASHSPLGLM